MSVDVCLLLLVAVLVVASFLLDLDTFLRDRRMRRPQQWFADFYPAVRIGSTAKLAAATGLTTRYMRTSSAELMFLIRVTGRRSNRSSTTDTECNRLTEV